MKIFVISDTHGKIDKAVEIFKMLKNIDLIIHLGDYFSDAKNLEKQVGVTVLGVKGNMDGSFSSDEYKVLETEFGKILLSHGHMENAKFSPQNLMYKAESLGCKAVFYGHTHVPVFEEVNRMYLLNPGSLSLPNGGRQASYAIVKTSRDLLEASIIYLSQTSKLENRQTNPGYIKNLLNNSDRF